MAPSQLKRLKQSLRDQGIVGPQKPKKARSKAKNEQASKDSQESRSARLQIVRDQFNPFEFKASDTPKFTVAGINARRNTSVHRPGATKSLGEEKRRSTLFMEMQRRQKIGGVMDRRFGEDDPGMTPEQKSLQRFVRERELAGRKASVFDLEEPLEDDFLTHLGRSLPQDVTEAERIQDRPGPSNVYDTITGRGSKRRRLSPSDSDSEVEPDSIHGANDQAKSRKEIMEEMIAKSKLHKYERQKEKEDDDDLRAELDKGLSDIFSALRDPSIARQGAKQEVSLTSAAPLNPDRQALIEGKDRQQADKEYDERLRQMIVDQRARPAMPTLTEEERLRRQADKAKELEDERLRRMRGDTEKQDSEDGIDEDTAGFDSAIEEKPRSAFGLGEGLIQTQDQRLLDVEDEDDFIIDGDVDTDQSDSGSQASRHGNEQSSTEGEQDDSLTGLSFDDEQENSLSSAKAIEIGVRDGEKPLGPQGCPDSIEAFLESIASVKSDQIPFIVQRIRALYHPRLDAQNKVRLSAFSAVLVEYLYHSTVNAQDFDLGTSEAIIRHIHSLAKMFPIEVGNAFRSHLRQIGEKRPDSLDAGDLIILTAISAIFPTSDHFHSIVTPAMLCMTRYLSQSSPVTLRDIITGTFVSTLCLQYQNMAQRYVPEVVNHVHQAFRALSPANIDVLNKQTPDRVLARSLQLNLSSLIDKQALKAPTLSFNSLLSPPILERDCETLKLTLLLAQLHLIGVMIDLYQSTAAFCEILAPFYQVLMTVSKISEEGEAVTFVKRRSEEVASKLQASLKESAYSRKSLSLHQHRPLPIKMSLPKFDESFNPEKHNDPDTERAELSKLKAQHKKEKKGALRELRKDAKFMAREDLREKKEKDAAYEKKFKRLVAEIQGEEGHESKAYEREKRKRLGKR